MKFGLICAAACAALLVAPAADATVTFEISGDYATPSGDETHHVSVDMTFDLALLYGSQVLAESVPTSFVVDGVEKITGADYAFYETGVPGGSLDLGARVGDGPSFWSLFLLLGSIDYADLGSQAFWNGAAPEMNILTSAGEQFQLTGNFAVKVTGAAPVPQIPEPATWAMMLTGFGMAGTIMRRRTASFARPPLRN